MAGSYGHVCPVLHSDDGSDTPYIGAWSRIENMGDAYECVEELLWLVLFFAQRSAQTTSLETADALINNALDTVYYPMARKEIPPDEAYQAVAKVMEGDSE